MYNAADGHVDYAICMGKTGLFAVKAAVYVDATGDGDLAVRAGAAFEKGDPENGNMQPGTLCSLWANVDVQRAHAQRRGQNIHERSFLPQAFADGVFTVNDPHMPGMWPVSEHMTGGNIWHAFGLDATDERSLTQAYLEGRRAMPEFEHFYKTYPDGYQNMELAATGSLMGVRETRRITGDYQLCLQDYLDRAVFDDEIGRYNYSVDIHPSSATRRRTYKVFAQKFHGLRYTKPARATASPIASCARRVSAMCWSRVDASVRTARH